MLYTNGYGNVLRNLPLYSDFAANRDYTLAGLTKFTTREYPACYNMNAQLLRESASNFDFLVIGVPILLGVALFCSIPTICCSILIPHENGRYGGIIVFSVLLVVLILNFISFVLTRSSYNELKLARKDLEGVLNMDCFFADHG